jgi:2-hydroxychromene-2-carboxylate isomerase
VTAKTVEYFLSPVSPYVYLGHVRFVALARAQGATVVIKPVDLARVFPVTGGLPLAKRAPQRQAYRLVELQRWGAFLNVPIIAEPKYFPCPADLASKWVIAAAEADPSKALAFIGAIGLALWAEQRNPADAGTLAALATANGLDAKAIGRQAEEASTGARYDALTQEAVEQGVFGAPTYVYRSELFWGQDRLDFLARALAQ